MYSPTVGLILVLWPASAGDPDQWKPVDPLLAIAVAINILWAGCHLV